MQIINNIEHQQIHKYRHFSLFIMPMLVMLPAFLIRIWLQDHAAVALDLWEYNQYHLLIKLIFIQFFQFLSFSALLSSVLYHFKLSVQTAKNYIAALIITISFSVLWELFKGDIDQIFVSQQMLDIWLYIGLYGLEFPLFLGVIYLYFRAISHSLDVLVDIPEKSTKYWRTANASLTFIISGNLSYYILKITRAIFTYDNQFNVNYLDSYYFIFMQLLVGVILFISVIFSETEVHKLNIKRSLFISGMLSIITISLFLWTLSLY